MRAKARSGALLLLCGLLLVLAFGVAPARANRALVTEKAVKTDSDPKHLIPPPEGEIEGACGIAIAPLGDIYVSDYYHHLIDVFSASGDYASQFPASTSPEGPCQLAFDSKGALYANLWHESVVRLKPSPQLFDEDSSTGVAVDGSGNVYVNDRTYVAVYEPSGVLLEQIGAGGSLKDAYGLAVFGERLYVPDAATQTVKVYEPAVNVFTPVATIAPPGGFNSLIDAAVTVDPTNGHVLVLDNLQPGFEHPKAAIDEFDSNGAFLGQLKKTVIDGEPSGLSVGASGTLYATSGNSELANVFVFGSYTESGPEGIEAISEAPTPSPAGASSAGVEEALAAPAAGSIDGAATSPAKATERRKAARRRASRRRAQAKRRAKRRQIDD